MSVRMATASLPLIVSLLCFFSFQTLSVGSFQMFSVLSLSVVYLVAPVGVSSSLCPST